MQNNMQNNMAQEAENVANNQMAQNANPYYNTNVNGVNTMANDAQQNMANPQIQNNNQSILNSLNSSEFIKGALIGVAAGYLLTNEKAQKAIFKTIAKGTSMLQMGVEEMKERFEDAKAEMEAE